MCRPELTGDNRGVFTELWKLDDWRTAGIPDRWVQMNEARSRKGVLRGLHYQRWPYAQSKLVRVTVGAVLDVAIDIRPESLTFGQHVAVELDARDGWWLYVPKGFAHGYLALAPSAVMYLIGGAAYEPSAESIISWDDPTIGIDWPISRPLLSPKDRDGAHRLGDAHRQGLLAF